MWRKPVQNNSPSLFCWKSNTATNQHEEYINIMKRQPILLKANMQEESGYIPVHTAHFPQQESQVIIHQVKQIEVPKSIPVKRASSLGTKVTFTYTSPASVRNVEVKKQKKVVTFRQQMRSCSTPKSSSSSQQKVNFGYESKRIPQIVTKPSTSLSVETPSLQDNVRYQRIIEWQPANPTRLIHSQCPFCHKTLTLVPKQQNERQLSADKWDENIITVLKCQCFHCHKQIEMTPQPGHNYTPYHSRIYETPRSRQQRRPIQNNSILQKLTQVSSFKQQQSAVTKATDSAIKKQQSGGNQLNNVNRATISYKIDLAKRPEMDKVSKCEAKPNFVKIQQSKSQIISNPENNNKHTQIKAKEIYKNKASSQQFYVKQKLNEVEKKVGENISNENSDSCSQVDKMLEEAKKQAKSIAEQV